MTALYSTLASDINNEIYLLRKKKKALAANRKAINKFGKKLNDLNGAGLFSSIMFIPKGGKGVKAYINVTELDGFAGGALLTILAAVEKAGVEFVTSNDYPDSSNREFVGRSEDGSLEVELNAYLKSDAKNCKRVVKGVEKIERPIYEFVCG